MSHSSVKEGSHSSWEKLLLEYHWSSWPIIDQCCSTKAGREVSVAKPETISTAINSDFHRRLLFWSCCKLLRKLFKSRADLEMHIQRDIPGTLKWFLEMYLKYPLKEPYDIYLMILIFWTLNRLHLTIHVEMPDAAMGREIIQVVKRAILQLQGRVCFVQMLLNEPSDWLKAYERKFVESMAVLIGTNEGLFGISEMALPVAIDNHIRQTQTMIRDLLNLPFAPLTGLQEQYISLCLQNYRNRGDLYSSFIAMIESLLNYMRRLFKRQTDKQADRASKRVVATRKKLSWYLDSILKFHTKKSMGSELSEALLSVCEDAQSELDEIDTSETRIVVSGLKLVLKVLKEELVSEQNRAIDIKPPSPVSSQSRTGLLTLLKRKRADGINMAKQTPISAVNASSIVSSDSSVLRPGSKENTLATIDCIWMDVDPMVERITMNGMVSEEILCSVASGIMQLTRTELLWSGVTCETLASMTLSSMLIPQHFYEVAVKVHLASILSFTSCTIKATPTKPDTGARSTANIFASDGDRRASDDHITKGMNGIKSNTMLFLPRTKAYALMVFTAEEVYKFYPFTEEEISKILKILTWLTGLAPFDEIDFIKKVLSKKLEYTRSAALRMLLQEPSPWIDHSADLIVILDNLTAELLPQKTIDMERLFHSCRLEIEVTKEALFYLRKVWHITQSELVKLKVLSIVDRLLDKVVMHNGNPAFEVTFKWLKYLEETVSPYKSTQALRLITALVNRAKAIQVEPLSAILNSQCHTMFDNYDDYLYWMQNFTDHGHRSHLTEMGG